MMSTHGDAWRIILNWIIPATLAIAIAKMATKVLAKKASWWGAILTGFISCLVGLTIGGIVLIALYDPNTDNLEATWKALGAAVFSTMIGDRVAHWFIYGFEIDQAMDDIAKLIFEKIKRLLK